MIKVQNNSMQFQESDKQWKSSPMLQVIMFVIILQNNPSLLYNGNDQRTSIPQMN